MTRSLCRRTWIGCAAMAVALAGMGACSSDTGVSGSPTSVATGSQADGSFCSLLLAFQTSNTALTAQLNGGNAAEVQAAVSRLVEQADLLRRKAPSEVSADTAIVAGFITSLDELLADYDYSLDAVSANPDAAVRFSELSGGDFPGAQAALVNYASTTCAAEAGS